MSALSSSAIDMSVRLGDFTYFVVSDKTSAPLERLATALVRTPAVTAADPGIDLVVFIELRIVFFCDATAVNSVRDID